MKYASNTHSKENVNYSCEEKKLVSDGCCQNIDEREIKENTAKLSELLLNSKELHAAVATAPTMLTVHEQHFLRLLAQVYYTGAGAIFDGGCCLGGCAQSFARGLADREAVPASTALHVYERGICEDYLTHFIKQRCGVDIPVGESFIHLVAENTSNCPGNEYLRLHAGDILQQEYPDYIEILFLDVCKTPEINHAMQLLLARGIPGKTVVIQQDYVHEWLPWTHVSLGFLHQYMEPIGTVGSSFAWLLKKNIPASLLRVDVWHELSLAEEIDCLMRFYGYLTPSERQYTDLAKAVLLAFHGMDQDAKRQIEMVRCAGGAGASIHQECDGIEQFVAGRCGQQPLPLQPQPDFSIATVCDVRKKSSSLGHHSLTTQKYQDDIAYFIANNRYYGDALLEVGCFKGGLTVQMAYMAQALGKHLYVVDISAEYLAAAEKIVTDLGFSDAVSFHCMPLVQFEEQMQQSKTRYILAVIDGSHYYPHVVEDCQALQRMHHCVRAGIFHDFTLHNYEVEQRVNDAIFDVFGHDVAYYPVGSNVGLGSLSSFLASETRGEEDHFFSGTEGVLIYGENMGKGIPIIPCNDGVAVNSIVPECVVQEEIVYIVDPILQETISRLEKDVQNLHDSMSWKVTAPLRWLYGTVLRMSVDSTNS